MDVFVTASFLALIANRVIEAFVAPIKKKYPELDMWWLIYPSWVFGGLLAWLAGINLFASLSLPEVAGRILTAVVVGGGANLIADIFSNKPASSGAVG
jgi:hypothetical protein